MSSCCCSSVARSNRHHLRSSSSADYWGQWSPWSCYCQRIAAVSSAEVKACQAPCRHQGRAGQSWTVGRYCSAVVKALDVAAAAVAACDSPGASFPLN